MFPKNVFENFKICVKNWCKKKAKFLVKKNWCKKSKICGVNKIGVKKQKQNWYTKIGVKNKNFGVKNIPLDLISG